MGLNLVVGILAELKDTDPEGYQHYLQQFEAVNAALQQYGLMSHMEGEDLGGRPAWSCEMGGYSALHCLRRIAAHLALGRPLPPPGDEKASEDPVVGEYMEYPRYFVHLMVHSDAEGFYVPLDFMPVVVPEESIGVAGRMIGSSYRLREECEELARQLELPLELEPESDEAVEAMGRQGEGDVKWKRYAIESHACLALYHAANKSIEMGAAVVFC